MPDLAASLEACSAPLLRNVGPALRTVAVLAGLLQRALVDEVPAGREPGFVRPGFRPDLDQLVELAQGGRAAIAAMEVAEKQRTGRTRCSRWPGSPPTPAGSDPWSTTALGSRSPAAGIRWWSARWRRPARARSSPTISSSIPSAA